MGNLAIITAVILRIFSNSFLNVFQKKLTAKNESPYSVNFVTYLILAICCIPLLGHLSGAVFMADFWLYSILSGIFGAFGNAFLIKALEQGELSVLGPINAYKSVIGLLGGIIFLKELPTLSGIVGIILIITGSYLVFDTVEEKFSLALFKRKDIQYRFYALFLTAIEAVFIKKVILIGGITVSCISTVLFGMIFSFLILKFHKIKISKITTGNILSFLMPALCFGLVMVTTAYTFAKINVGYALSLFQLSILLNVFLGYKFFQEKHLLKKSAGALIIILGSIFIILY